MPRTNRDSCVAEVKIVIRGRKGILPELIIRNSYDTSQLLNIFLLNQISLFKQEKQVNARIPCTDNQNNLETLTQVYQLTLLDFI